MFEPLDEPLGRHEAWLGHVVSCTCGPWHLDAFLLVPLTGIYGILVQVQLGFLISPTAFPPG
jgi:hypothetical protein